MNKRKKEGKMTDLTWTLEGRAWSNGPTENWLEMLDNPEQFPEVTEAWRSWTLNLWKD